MTRALIIVDVQNDFCEGGSLAVAGGAGVAKAISDYLGSPDSLYDAIAATKDHHIDPGDHFAEEPDFVDSWPAHCIAESTGSQFHPNLETGRIEAVFLKGSHAAAYSGFEGADDADTSLAEWLRARGIAQVDVVGIATDHCVCATALDAVAEGFQTRVLLDLTAGVAPETTARALEKLTQAGAELVGQPVLGGGR